MANHPGNPGTGIRFHVRDLLDAKRIVWTIGPSLGFWAVLVGFISKPLLIPAMTFALCLTYTGEPWSSMLTMLRPARLGIPLLVWGILLTWVPWWPPCRLLL